MSGNSFGKLFQVTTFGESHGQMMGVVIDGMPPSIRIDINDLQNFVDKRSAKNYEVATQRKEPDQVIIVSGTFENKTLGSPITVLVENKKHISKDYDKLKDQFRPGHADQTTIYKFGTRDHRGGGRASGRETISRVIAGYFAGLILKNTQFGCYISSIGDKFIADEIKSIMTIDNRYSFKSEKIQESHITQYLSELKKSGESIGGKVTLLIENAPKGLGEPCFDKIKADLAKAMLSIGSCMGFSIGKENIDQIKGSQVSNQRSFFGGVEGGITNGEQIRLQLSFKPPSTVGENAKEGRHDPCILPRVLIVVESMAKIVLADHFLRQSAYQMTLPEYSR